MRANDPSDQFAAEMNKLGKALDAASNATLKEVASTALKAAKQNLAESGFGSKWQDAMRATVGQNKAVITSVIGFIAVFEDGAVIHGKPRLWLPIDPNLPSLRDQSGERWTPRRYISAYGRLRLVAHPGRDPLLYDPRSKKFVFVGVSQVTIKKKIDIGNAVKSAVADFDKRFDANFKVD